MNLPVTRPVPSASDVTRAALAVLALRASAPRPIAGCIPCEDRGRLACAEHGELSVTGGTRVRFLRPDRVADLEKKVRRLAKRAEVLGMTPPALITADEIAVPYKTDKGATVYEMRTPVVAVGESPVLNGWKFLARIDHAPVLNTIAAASDAGLPARFWTAPADCQHCALDRRRKQTYVVTDGDKIVQVGASCLADFLGHPNPDHFAQMAEWEAALDETDGDDEWSGGGGGSSVQTAVAFLAYVADVIATCGWRPASRADEEHPSTSSIASVRLYKESRFVTLEKADATARAEAVIAWVKSLYGDGSDETIAALSDYHRNLVAAVLAGVATRKTYGILASAYASKDHADGVARAKAATRLPSVHFGTVAKREVFTFTVTRVFDNESEYGVTHMHLMVDAAGNVAKWQSSSHRFEPGDIVSGKGTVKAHTEYRGTPQTVLSRCAFEVIGTAETPATTEPKVPRGYLIGE